MECSAVSALALRTSGLPGFGMLAALLVTVGNAGGVGATVAGVARVPFVAGIDHYLPGTSQDPSQVENALYFHLDSSGNLGGDPGAFPDQRHGHRRVSVSGFHVGDSVFHPFLYRSRIKLAHRKDRDAGGLAVLVPGGMPGIWIAAPSRF